MVGMKILDISKVILKQQVEVIKKGGREKKLSCLKEFSIAAT